MSKTIKNSYLQNLKPVNQTFKMASLTEKYAKYIPYLYFISVIISWFTYVNTNQGISAYPILLFSIPFIWQLIKPSRKLNFSLGITFVCISSFLILGYIIDALNILNIYNSSKNILFLSGIGIIANLIMALWILRNSLKRLF